MISYSENMVVIDGTTAHLAYPIAEAFELDGRVIVLLDPDARTERFGQFPNLLALAPDGDRLWTAELPTTTSGDRYYRITSQRPLVVESIYSEECEIDQDTGAIKSRRFLK